MSSTRNGDLYAFRSGKEIQIVEIRNGKFIGRSRLTQNDFDAEFGIPHDFTVSPDGTWLATCELHKGSTQISS
ncbi:hypothetical protein Q8G39_28585, partial [Klebsiella pneumoniae]|uniref:hypothetical protein n=1 Tax=Klebsiella pneumoniae TaxID=573 RepID=UPI003013551E